MRPLHLPLAALLVTSALAAPSARADTTSLFEERTSSFAAAPLSLRNEWAAMRTELVAEPRWIGNDMASPAGERAFALASESRAGEAVFDLRLAIWHCIRAIRAQHENRPLQLIETRLNVVNTLTPQVSAVPLPGAAWLMLMGLLGVAGTRLTRRRKSAQGDVEPGSFGAPTPAAA